jgi:hypothetical protein
VAEGQEALGREIAVGELVAEEDAHDRGDAKRATHQPLLILIEAQHAHVREDFDLPRPPDGDLEDHHEEQLDLDGRLRGGVGHKWPRG